MSVHEAVVPLLDKLEQVLVASAMWSAIPPSAEALASEQPFCIDTLTLPEWLQYVFLVRMRRLLDNQLPLPPVSGIAPMVELYFQQRQQSGEAAVEIQQVIGAIDLVLSAQST